MRGERACVGPGQHFDCLKRHYVTIVPQRRLLQKWLMWFVGQVSLPKQRKETDHEEVRLPALIAGYVPFWETALPAETGKVPQGSEQGRDEKPTARLQSSKRNNAGARAVIMLEPPSAKVR